MAHKICSLQEELQQKNANVRKEKISAIHNVTVKDSQANADLHNTYPLYLNSIPVLNRFFCII